MVVTKCCKKEFNLYPEKTNCCWESITDISLRDLKNHDRKEIGKTESSRYTYNVTRRFQGK